jgi:hypothetical protein
MFRAQRVTSMLPRPLKRLLIWETTDVVSEMGVGWTGLRDLDESDSQDGHGKSWLLVLDGQVRTFRGQPMFVLLQY